MKYFTKSNCAYFSKHFIQTTVKWFEFFGMANIKILFKVAGKYVRARASFKWTISFHVMKSHEMWLIFYMLFARFQR